MTGEAILGVVMAPTGRGLTGIAWVSENASLILSFLLGPVITYLAPSSSTITYRSIVQRLLRTEESA